MCWLPGVQNEEFDFTISLLVAGVRYVATELDTRYVTTKNQKPTTAHMPTAMITAENTVSGRPAHSN